MVEYKKTKLILIVTFLAASFLVFIWSIDGARAATSTLRGKAWWGSDQQYLYFNCLDDIIGDRLDDPYNLCGGNGLGNILYCAPYMPDNVFHFYSEPCSSLIHKVEISNNGNFSGSAWNYSQGLISFQATITPPADYSFNSHCPACTVGANCSACYSESDQKVYGWAQVASDGTWIRLDSATTTPVQIQAWNIGTSTLAGHGIQPGDFVGYATTTAQTLSFNCESEWNGASLGNCDNRDYKVYISNLQVGHMSAPNWNYSQACSSSANTVVLMWKLKSGYYDNDETKQTAYRVIINTSNSTSSPVFDSGKITGSADQFTCWSSLCSWTPSYNTSYYWWVQLWDENDVPTELYQYGVNDGHSGLLDEHTNIAPDTDDYPKTFKTYSHEFPNPFFVWEPVDVVIASTTLFTSNYYSLTPAPRNCYGACTYLWTTNYFKDIIASSTNVTTTIKFFYATSSTVYFGVTDASNYYCSTSTSFIVNDDLPIWREVKAR